MKTQIIIDASPFFYKGAIIEEGKLTELHIMKRQSISIVGNVYIGKVRDIHKGIEAAFVDIGQKQNAFLFMENGQKLRPGDDILVQVEKEASGTKGAVVRNRISFAGNNLVLFPFQGKKVNISARITDIVERNRLKLIIESVIPDNYGAIIRTSAEGQDAGLLENELAQMVKNADIVLSRHMYAKAPALLYKAPSFWYKLVIDTLAVDINEIVVNNREIYEDISAIENIQCKTHYLDAPLFEQYQLDDKLEKALRRKVWLKSGGYIVIDETEALTVVDVNTGKAKGKKNFSGTVFSINKEAAIEILRQLRLRNISGIIVIDFIDMTDKQNDKDLLEILTACARKDRRKTVVVGMADLGLVLLTRHKTTEPLSRILLTPHNDLVGGRQYAPLYTASKIMQELAHFMADTSFNQFTITAPQEVTKLLSPDIVKTLTEKYTKSVTLKSVQSFELPGCAYPYSILPSVNRQ